MNSLGFYVTKTVFGLVLERYFCFVEYSRFFSLNIINMLLYCPLTCIMSNEEYAVKPYFCSSACNVFFLLVAFKVFFPITGFEQFDYNVLWYGFPAKKVQIKAKVNHLFAYQKDAHFYFILPVWMVQINLNSFANGDLALGPGTQAPSQALSSVKQCVCCGAVEVVGDGSCLLPLRALAPQCQQALPIYVLPYLWSMWLYCVLSGWS